MKRNMSNELGHIRLQVDFAVVEAQFVADAMAADVDGAGGYVEEFCDFFCGFSFFDQVGNLDLPRGQIHVDRGELGGKGGNDVPQV